MVKKGLKFLSLVSASFIATSCSIFSTRHFNWLSATKNNEEINYALLIGQNEHSDSIERTRSTRDALNTRDEATEINGNANLGRPKIGYLPLGGKDGVPEQTFKVTELEHMEQKSLAGVTWDPITANGTTATWICKHGKKLTAIVSNNDGMAEGALAACNWIEGLPLFGYDANFSTLKKIKEGKIAGTVDQNAAIQTATAYKLIRNILDDLKNHTHNIGEISYNPIEAGFKKDPREDFYINGTDGTELGYLTSTYSKNLNLSERQDHALLARSTAYTENNISEMIDDKGNIKSVEELAWNDDKVWKKPSYTPPEDSYKICHVYNNNAEVYLQGTMWPFYKVYAPILNLDVTKIDGDGIDESIIFNKLTSACQKTKFDAFLINMVTTTDGGAYIDKIANEAAKNEHKTLPEGGWSKWEDRLDTPVVFWNKQPKTIKGEVDLDIMNNKFFKYTYYVGVDAAEGGRVQGEMIRNYFEQRYINSVRENNK